MNEKDYKRGHEAGRQLAWRHILRQAVVQLPGGEWSREGLLAERNGAVAALREVCRDHGDLDWPDNLHLADVIEKHLARHLDGQREAVRVEVQKLRETLDEVAEEVTGLLKERNRLMGEKATLLMKNLRLSRQAGLMIDDRSNFIEQSVLYLKKSSHWLTTEQKVRMT